MVTNTLTAHRRGYWLLLGALLVTTAVYWSGLSGGWLFDDYPNIVDNSALHVKDGSLSSLLAAALSSPSSELKRPLASLSFAANYLATGLDPYGMKLTNLFIHLLNGWLVFLLAKTLLCATSIQGIFGVTSKRKPNFTEAGKQADVTAALIAASWMLLPINLTAVLYVVQRMESMANLFVLVGLLGYVAGRRRMLVPRPASDNDHEQGRLPPDTRGFILCLISMTLPAVIGVLAKETAVMLPLYALLVEWTLFHFSRPKHHSSESKTSDGKVSRDPRIIGAFLVILVIPLVLGLAWLLPGVTNPASWAVRDFTLGTRLLSEARIVIDYIAWTLLPTPNALSFYHDDFAVSTGLLAPWTTLTSILLIAALLALTLWLRNRRPLAALGIALFIGCQLLTGTILPLELIYEHRNYFASFGLLLALLPLLAAPAPIRNAGHGSVVDNRLETDLTRCNTTGPVVGKNAPLNVGGGLPMALPRYTLLAGLMLYWVTLTALTAHAWGDPLRLAEDLAARAPQSSRAQYELGRTYIIYSRYDPTSPFTLLAYAPLEKAASLPEASILPEQALIFMNARMHLPLKDAWWDSMITKLAAHKPGVQDESSLEALTKCAHENHCDLPKERMVESFQAALSHPRSSARLFATYGDYAWNVLDNHVLGLQMTEAAVKTRPNEPAYRITQIRMLASQGQKAEADRAMKQLETLNVGGLLNAQLVTLRALPGLQ